MAIGAPVTAAGRAAGLWSLAFWPFFLAAAVWAALALALWIVLFMAGSSLPNRFDPLSWHIHAMLFGFVLAAIAGFMMTAIPQLDRPAPINGAPLIGLVALWLLGRVVCLVSACRDRHTPGSGAPASSAKHASSRAKEQGGERQHAQQHNACVTQIGDPPAEPGNQPLEHGGPNHPRDVLAG